MEKKVLAVGDSTRLEIIFHTRKYRGKIAKSPRIQTSEGKPDKHVKIATQVTDRPDSTYPIVIQPYKLDMSQFSEKVIEEKKFMITNVSDQKLDVGLVAMPDDLVEIKLPKSIKPGKNAKCKVKLKKDAFGDSFEKSITIEVVGVEDKATTRFSIPLKRTLHIARTPPPQEPGSGKKDTP